MEVFNLEDIIYKLVNRESKETDFFTKKGSTIINFNFAKKNITVTTSHNKNKDSAIIMISKIVNLDTHVYISINKIQTTQPILKILNSNNKVIDEVSFSYKKGSEYIVDFNLKNKLKHILNDNNTCFTPINLMISESSRALPKKIYIINQISIVSTENNTNNEKLVNEVDNKSDSHHNSENVCPYKNNNKNDINVCNKNLNTNDKLSNNSDIKNEMLCPYHNGNNSKGIVEVNVDTNENQVSINNEIIEFSSKKKTNIVTIDDNCVSHKGCKGNVDYFILFPNVLSINLPIRNYILYCENAVTEYTRPDNLNRIATVGHNIFGQFIVHDMTFNKLGKLLDNDLSFKNDETPKLDLHALYGNPRDVFYFHEDKFIYNKCSNDLQRNFAGKPIIPDPRNDENYVIAQMHLLFQKFHNKLIDYYKPTIKTNLFKFVKQQVLFYYQWLIVNEFLPKWVDNSIIEDLFTNYNFKYDAKTSNSALPIEWAMAIARSGHLNFPSHIRVAYDLVISEKEIHVFTGSNLPKYNIDWTNFFEMTNKDYDINYCKKYDGTIISDLADMVHLAKPPDLPTQKNNLFLRNLLRAQQFGLGTGQDYAKEYDIEPIPEILLRQYDKSRLMESSFMTKETPLLLYAIKEAEIYKSGDLLTGVGGRIFAEVILGILFNDKESYFHTNSVWKPILGKNDNFTFVDMIAFVYSDDQSFNCM